MIDRILELVGTNAEAIVTVSEGTAALTRFANSRIHQNHAEDTHRVSLSVIVEGRRASASTNQTDDDSLKRLVDRAIEAARLRPPDPDWPGLAPPAPEPAFEHYDDDTAAASPDRRAAVVRAFVDAGPGLQGAGYCSTEARSVTLASTAGQRLSGRVTSALLSGIHSTGTADGSGRAASVRIADLDGAASGAIAASKARESSDAIDVEPGRYEVVLEPSCVANMLQFLASSGFNAKSVQDGTSFALVGNMQFDETVSIWDDAADPRMVGLPFDMEGTPKRHVDLVLGGVTAGVVHSRRTAAKAGVESTGHGGGSDAFGPIAANVILGAGGATREELIAGVSRGLLVTDFNYTRILDPKTQVVTGLTRNGTFLIENGAVTKAVKNLRFTQSYVAALGPGNVLGIGSDATLAGGYVVPSVRLRSWNFTGGARG